ncbi:MAG: circadian clock KaiB family protein [Trueperaceae bacterium]|nr:circadian clock KaiB family protein [Trueperaceae bacterium]
MESYRFELYVAGDVPSSRTAVRALTDLCEERLRGRYELDVIDVLAHPERAESERILATPTLLKLSPAPRVRIVGDLSLTANVLAGLGLNSEQAGDEELSP